jgi:hypothetical protein
MLFVETPAVGQARLPDRLTGEFTPHVDDGIRSFDRQAERPDPARDPAVRQDEAELIPHWRDKASTWPSGRTYRIASSVISRRRRGLRLIRIQRRPQLAKPKQDCPVGDSRPGQWPPDPELGQS